MKEMLTFRGINVDVLTITKVSTRMLKYETERLFTAVVHISKTDWHILNRLTGEEGGGGERGPHSTKILMSKVES